MTKPLRFAASALEVVNIASSRSPIAFLPPRSSASPSGSWKTHQDGYCGDEDNGQTSAWYVWSALGFYPVCPGSGEYALGSPAVEKAVVSVRDGAKLTIEAPGASVKRYVASVTFNGRPVRNGRLNQAELLKGGKLYFKMSDKLNQEGK